MDATEKCWNCGREHWGRYCVTCGRDKTAAAPTPIDAEILPPLTAEVRLSVPPRPTLHAELPAGTIAGLHGALQSIGAGRVAARATEIIATTDESMVWEDCPSIALLAGLMLKYVAALAAAMWIASTF